MAIENIEVQLGRLDERFKALEKKVDAGNFQVLAEIKDLKDNILKRLEHVESTKLSASDFITFKTEAAAVQEDHEKRLREIEALNLEEFKNKTEPKMDKAVTFMTLITGGLILLQVLATLYLKYL